MTSQETPWWRKEPFNVRCYEKYCEDYDHPGCYDSQVSKIVAEAERRGIEKGKREALEDVRRDFISQLCNDHNGYVRWLRGAVLDEDQLLERILAIFDTKLSSLSQSSNERV